MIQVQKKIKTQVLSVLADSGTACREYAGPGRSQERRQEKVDLKREREKLKESLLPFVREAVRKQLKEEREYYRSRPSLAARQLEGIVGQGQLVSTVADLACDRVESRMRLERIRRGR